jgi:uncharacterized protein (TIGR00297 family)
VTSAILVALLGIFANLPIGVLAHKKRALTLPGGMITAAIVGFTIFFSHYLLWSLLLLFFASSTLLTKFKENSEYKIKAMTYAEKGGERDSIQVLANGGTALIGSLILLLTKGYFDGDVFSPLFLFIAVSVAASTADTWSTEVGTTSSSDPVWIFNLKKRVPRGTSGGVSIRGTLASIIGSLVIALTYFIFVIAFFDIQIQFHEILFLLLLVFGGFLGGMIDTILGATVQAVYECPACEKMTEKTRHPRCEYVKTNHKTGFKLLNNDGVNFFSGLLASLFMVAIFSLLMN